MFSSSALPTLRFRISETVWLDRDAGQIGIGQANRLAAPSASEAEQWQLYLNALALLGFEQWLQQRTSLPRIDKTECINKIEAIYGFRLNGFKLNMIVKEHVLDEVADIPKEAVQSDLAAHFYVLLEVSEEEQRVIIRGFLRGDELVAYCNQISCLHGYKIPLAIFDLEPNHLLFYCDFLDPAAMPSIAASESTVFTPQKRIQIGEWIQGMFSEGWQALEDLFSPEAYFACSIRNQTGAKRGKLIDLGLDLHGQRAILLVNVTEADREKLAVLVQLHPVRGERYLPADITLTLLSQTGEKLQEVCARTQDNFIQLKTFKGTSGILFKILIHLNDVCLCEQFEL